MLEKYPDVNRTGCALVYMGQMSKDEEKEKYLKQAIEKFSDCYYLNGVQVVPWARALLGYYYQENGRADEATKLFEEVKKNHPDAIDHQGRFLVKLIEADATTQPAE
jgi:hypothetical protein